MAAQVLALGIVLIVVLLILVARARTGRANDPEDARGLIGEAIDAHIEALAESYLEARAERAAGRPGTDGFDQAIELFIGDVLWRRAGRSEPHVREALREILVLQRDDVYGEVRARVEAHLRPASSAERPAPACSKVRV